MSGPLIITGMHRSGTSMVAGLLGACGLGLGERLIEPDAHNPRGYHEDAEIVALQGRMLKAATRGGRGGWPDWGYTEDRVFDRSTEAWFEDEARACLNERAARAEGAWGWKDPRSTFLLDFWQERAPGMNVCAVYRDPWDVAASIGRQGSPAFSEPATALDIWLAYNRALLEFLARHPERVLLVAALRVMERPDELPRRLADRFGPNLQAPPQLEREIDPNLLGAPEHPRVIEEALSHPGVEATLDELHAAAAMPGVLPAAGLSKVSVVIPCYNDGATLAESVASVTRGRLPHAEIVVVDDGSDDPATVETIEAMGAHGCRVIRQPNRGLWAARNAGVEAAAGDYILPLDADNRAHPNYLIEAVAALDRDPALDVVYASPCFIGDRADLWSPPDFDLTRLLAGNFIDACALIRRRTLLEAEGYDTTLPSPAGYEDWELWIRLADAGRRFQRLEGFLFDYRVRSDSLTRECRQPPHHEALVRHIAGRHAPLYRERAPEVFVVLQARHNELMLHHEAWQATLSGEVKKLHREQERLRRVLGRTRAELKRERRHRKAAERKRRRMERTAAWRMRAFIRGFTRAFRARGNRRRSGERDGGGGA